ncbi:MAG: A/G-specific adenine glycosylase [Kiritimatiellia bacterium]|jgi:A/G-specific adenine glycosylase
MRNARPSPQDDVERLLAWFSRARRDLPWRTRPADPYRVWVSEIMLQQTRIDTVRGYFDRFLSAFPTVSHLAAADLQRVLALWQGLGYYSRARNLHAAAKRVEAEFGGVLPSDSPTLRSLPGIGAYSAAAIASICHGERTPAVDGNVLRITARRLVLDAGIRTPAARAAVQAWLDPRIAVASDPGDFNQAMMELGETLCSPRSPQCPACPWSDRCAAFAAGTPEAWPVKAKAKPVPVRRAVSIVLRRRDGRFLLVKRAGERFLGEMWELPGGFLAEGEKPRAGLARLLAASGIPVPKAGDIGRRGVVRHVYSHFKLEMTVYAAPAPSRGMPRENASARWAAAADLPDLPLSKAPKLALELAGAT